jgi:Domain of unknown function (DUF4832)/Domain of unknown function (DUF4874)
MKIKIIFLVFYLLVSFINAQNNLVPQNINFTEYVGDIPNPDRGFYTPHAGGTVPISGGTQGGGSQAVRTLIKGTNTYVDVRISYASFNLRNFSGHARVEGVTENAPISADGLAYYKRTMDSLRVHDGVVLMHHSYDNKAWDEHTDQLAFSPEPYGQCTVPGFEHLNWVQYHIKQLEPIWHENEDIIFAFKGGFFGPWGEMHSSEYGNSPAAYAWLMQALLDAVPASRKIAVHGGAYISWYNVRHNTIFTFYNMGFIPVPLRDTPESRFGLLNDSYANGLSHMNGLYSDMDSFSEGAQILGTKYDFDRDKVLNWISGQNAPVGGETNEMSSRPYDSPPSIFYEAAIMGTTHLNTAWYGVNHKRWEDFEYNEANVTAPIFYPHNGKTVRVIFDPAYEGRNGLEYMRDRLGYRLVLRKALASSSVKQGGDLQFSGKIQNVGFGNIFNRKNVYVLLENSSTAEVYKALTNLDARDWLKDQNIPMNNRSDNTASYRDLNFSVNLGEFQKAVPPGNYNIYMKISDPKAKQENLRNVRFANNNSSDGPIWNAMLGANRIGSMTVTVKNDNGGFVAQYKVGDTGPGGGRIVYVNPFGFDILTDPQNPTVARVAHYIEVGPEDIAGGKPVTWASRDGIYAVRNGIATYPQFGAGLYNTGFILRTTDPVVNPGDPDAPAAKACDEYVRNGLNDWYLPTQDELMEIRKYVLNNPGDPLTKNMLGKKYWSSTDTIRAWPVCIAMEANSSWRNTGSKFDAAHKNYVRPVRAF